MKGINLKKIGAIVAGATILASSVAFASLMYGNTELVDANGQPVAKVVLGSNAQVSDGVVAASIASKLASAAYAKKTLTAAVANDATCTTTGSTGNGTCAISNEKVTLEVTVPGSANSGIHAFVTDIGDYIDRMPENRINNLTDDIFELSESETDVDANPFSDGEGGSLVIGDVAMYRISGTNYVPFMTKTINDPNTGDTYTELQNAFLEGTTEYVDADKAIEATPSLFLYQVKFDDSKHFGIPVCTTDENSDGNWADCATGDPEYTGKHRVKISFLGSDWIITEMNPAGTTTSTDEVVLGGSVKIAKESVYGIVNVGEQLTSKDGQLKIRLDDISTPVTGGNIHPAIVTFLDANGNVLSQDQIDPGSTIKKTIGGKTYRVRVYQTAPGYTFGAKWAEMAMLESELELKDSDTLETTGSDTSANDDWNVNVLWKNRDASASEQDVDYWRGVLLYRSSFGDSLTAGGSINMAEDPVAYKLTYKGLDLASGDYDSLKVATATTTTLTMVDDSTCKLNSNEYLKATSGVDDAFELTSAPIVFGDNVTTATLKGKEVYYLLANTSSDCGSLPAGDIIMKKSGSNPARYL
ncbi:MAG: S-layer protein, partial [Candidatus ainarchaeum sp.]|nr:S-layer protein [Candidatus ainarchaeum sp.]